MPQRNDPVAVEANGRVIEVPQSYVDRFPDTYKPVKLKQDGGLPAELAKKMHDARGDALPPFASTLDELPATGTAIDTDDGAAVADTTDGGTPA